MSWLPFSLPNPFKSVEEEEEEEEEEENQAPATTETEGTANHGVKEDLSVLTQTISRQLWGVASFLAPPPSPSPSSNSPDSSSQTLLGIRNDFAEIGGSFKTGLSGLSNLLLFQPDDDIDDDDSGSSLAGVTDEVLEFARDISARPESWTDFPLPLSDDFEMSNAQREHASTVERLIPSLAALRIRLCSGHISEGYFWKIYFFMLQPILHEHDSEILMTPETVEAQSMMRQQLKNRTNTQVQSSEVDWSSPEVSNKGIIIQEESNEIQEKEVLAETVTPAHDLNAHAQENVNAKKHGNEEDVSFSDLEIDDDDDDEEFSRRVSSRLVQETVQISSSNEWVQLRPDSEANGGKSKATHSTLQKNNQAADESSDWFTVDDFDLDNGETS